VCLDRFETGVFCRPNEAWALRSMIAILKARLELAFLPPRAFLDATKPIQTLRRRRDCKMLKIIGFDVGG
jgi:hypothetical protein